MNQNRRSLLKLLSVSPAIFHASSGVAGSEAISKFTKTTSTTERILNTPLSKPEPLPKYLYHEQIVDGDTILTVEIFDGVEYHNIVYRNGIIQL